MTALITREELKAYPLPVTDKQWAEIKDSQVDTVIEQASVNIEDWLDRYILSRNYIETFHGNGRYTQMLEGYPVTAVSNISRFDSLGVEKTYDQTYFDIDSGSGIITWIDKTRYNFNRQYDWQISYTAGMSEVPGPVKYATMLQTVKMLQPMFRSSSNFQGVKLIDGLDSEIVDALEKYKRKRIG